MSHANGNAAIVAELEPKTVEQVHQLLDRLCAVVAEHREALEATLMEKVAALEERMTTLERNQRRRLNVELHVNSSPPMDYHDTRIAERRASAAIEGVKEWERRLTAVEARNGASPAALDTLRRRVDQDQETFAKMRDAWSALSARIATLEASKGG
jgi:uncharacterized coiled-coil protein SlyX